MVSGPNIIYIYFVSVSLFQTALLVSLEAWRVQECA